MKQIFVELDRCNGCLTCTLACAAQHSQSQDILGAMAEGTPSRIFVQAVNCKPVPVLCRHCEEPACVDACMSGAMRKDRDTGIVTNEGHAQQCIGCWMCIMVCPFGVITQQNGESRTALKCDLCPGRETPACVESCPNKALVFAEPDEYAALLRQRSAESEALERAAS